MHEVSKYLVNGGDDGGRLLAGHTLQGGAQEGGAGAHRLQTDLLLLRVQVGVGTVPHKLGIIIYVRGLID